MGLKKLCCVNCPLLLSIPLIVGLQILDCGDCSSIKNIPTLIIEVLD